MWNIGSAGRLLIAVGLLAVSAAPVSSSAARGQDPPPSQQPTMLFDGSDVFRTYCVVCHGEGGKGNGPLAASLKKPPADLTQFAKRNKGVYPRQVVAQIIDGRQPVAGHGGGDMPVWGDAFSRSGEKADPASVQKKIAALVDYLETLQEK